MGGVSAAPIQRFSELPGLIARELASFDHVVVVLLDAFGWTFVQRHAQHPLLRRIARDGTLASIRSQFPSTTTAHVTTMHTGLPVEDHGLYEWRIYEPALDAITIPLLVPPDAPYARSLLPDGPTFYQRLAVRHGARSVVYSPDHFSPSGFDAVALRGADLIPYGDLASLPLAPVGEKTYTYIYYDLIDTMGHIHGPSSPEFDDTCLRALDAIYTTFFGPESEQFPSTLLIVTADHGQIDVSPERVTYLSLPGVQPAGSSRDLFLDLPESEIPSLNAHLGDSAQAVPTSTLFPHPGPRLSARVPPICILPSPGHQVWLKGHEDVETKFLGHHGGLTPEESTTFLGALALDQA
jgi:Type I phosphodiesterase / nucleotide pyrophosphatase